MPRPLRAACLLQQHMGCRGHSRRCSTTLASRALQVIGENREEIVRIFQAWRFCNRWAGEGPLKGVLAGLSRRRHMLASEPHAYAPQRCHVWRC